MMATSQSINNQQQLSTCVENQRSSFLSWVRSLLSLLTEKLRPILQGKALTAQAIHAGRVAVNELVNSKRFIAGVVLIWIVAPLIEVAYLLFDSTVREDWYYLNTYWYLFTIGPHLKLICWSLGAFLLFPTKWTLRYLAMIVPVGASVTKIIQLSGVTTNENFHAAPSWEAIVGGAFIAPALLLCTDYLLYRKYHLSDGNTARIIGMVKAPGIDSKTKLELLKTLVNERENFYSRI